MKFKTTMEKELKIEVPQGYEIDRQKSTFEKIIFKKIAENPKTWEEYCVLTKGSPSFFARCNAVDTSHYTAEYNEFSTRERAEQFIALGKLLQLRDYWVGGWRYNAPNFNDSVFAVFYSVTSNDAQITNISYANLPLTFPTKEMAQKFIECFEDLIKEAYPLV